DPSWTAIRDVEVVVVHFWVDSHFKIASVDPDRHVVTLDRRSGRKFTDDNRPVPGRYYPFSAHLALNYPEFPVAFLSDVVSPGHPPGPPVGSPRLPSHVQRQIGSHPHADRPSRHEYRVLLSDLQSVCD